MLSKMPQTFLDLVKTAIFFLRMFKVTHDRAKRKLGLVTSNQDTVYIGNRSEVKIMGVDRRSGRRVNNFRRISMHISH